MNTLVQLTPLEAQFFWPEAEPFLRPAVHHTDPEAYLQLIHSRIVGAVNQLWRISDEEGISKGYAVTELYTAGHQVIAQIHMGAGKLEDFLEQLDSFEYWAREQGAQTIQIIGRKGWEKIMKPFGFNHDYTSLTKRVNLEFH